jgi:hypothetical protein
VICRILSESYEAIGIRDFADCFRSNAQAEKGRTMKCTRKIYCQVALPRMQLFSPCPRFNPVEAATPCLSLADGETWNNYSASSAVSYTRLRPRESFPPSLFGGPVGCADAGCFICHRFGPTSMICTVIRIQRLKRKRFFNHHFLPVRLTTSKPGDNKSTRRPLRRSG